MSTEWEGGKPVVPTIFTLTPEAGGETTVTPQLDGKFRAKTSHIALQPHELVKFAERLQVVSTLLGHPVEYSHADLHGAQRFLVSCPPESERRPTIEFGSQANIACYVAIDVEHSKTPPPGGVIRALPDLPTQPRHQSTEEPKIVHTC